MDHAYAEEHGLVESYLAGRLSDSEREAFEAHYFACDACMEQLEAASDFREGMLEVAAEDTARAAAEKASASGPQVNLPIFTLAAVRSGEEAGRDALVILLPSSMLPSGVYQLTIEGVKGGSQRFAVGVYPFRVVRPLAQ